MSTTAAPASRATGDTQPTPASTPIAPRPWWEGASEGTGTSNVDDRSEWMPSTGSGVCHQ